MISLMEKHNLYCCLVKQVGTYINLFCMSIVIGLLCLLLLLLYFELSVSGNDIICIQMT